MKRLAMVLVGLLGFLSPLSASLAPRPDAASREKTVTQALARETTAQSQQTEFRIDEETEVKLDGRVCTYEKVPASATIILLEVDSQNKKLVTRIHFRSQK